MDRNYLVFRILELIHEVTGVWLDDDSPLDFESDHEWHVYNIWFAIWNEFLAVDYEQAKQWDYVSDIIRDVGEGMGLNDPWCYYHSKDDEGLFCTAHINEERVFACPYKSAEDSQKRRFPCVDYRVGEDLRKQKEVRRNERPEALE